MNINPSPRFVAALLSFHLVVAVVVCVTEVSLAVRLAVLPAILLSLFYHLGRDALLRFADSWLELSLGQGSVTVVTRAGSRFTGKLAHNTFVSPGFIVLRINLEGRLLSLSRVIFADAMDAGEYRELCVRLRLSDWGRERSAADSPASPDSPC